MYLQVFVAVEIGLATLLYFKFKKYNRRIDQKAPSLHDPATKGSPTSKDGKQKSLNFQKLHKIDANPFVNTTWALTEYECLKLAIGGVTLFPVRLLAILFNVVSISSYVSIVLPLAMDEGTPLFKYRDILIIAPMRISCRFILFCMGFLWVPVKGKPASAEEAPVIVVGPHVSVSDFFALGSSCTPSPVAEKAFLANPLLRPLLRALRLIALDRQSKTAREDTKAAILKHAGEAQSGKTHGIHQVLIFPEGCTHHSKSLIGFKNGGFLPGRPIQPVLLRYSWKFFDPCWVFCGPGQAMLMFRMLCQFYNSMSVEWLPVYKPSKEEQTDVHAFAENVRQYMGKALDVPTTGHSVETVMLQYAALKIKLPADSASSLEIDNIKEFFKIDKDTVKKHMAAFANMDKDKDGKVNLEDFIGAFEKQFHAPSESQIETLTQIFNCLDEDDSGTLSFREYLLGMALKAEEGDNAKDVCEYAFTALDEDGKGKLSKDEMAKLLRRVNPEITLESIDDLFKDVNKSATGAVTFDEFYEYALNHHTYVKMFQDSFL